MKIHKKLFSLLATAAVGLTLTSCGGGGGGGGGSSDDTPSVDNSSPQSYSVPRSMVGKTMTLVVEDWVYTLRFDSPSTVSGTVRVSTLTEMNVANGRYGYSADVATLGQFTNLKFDLENKYNNVVEYQDWDMTGLKIYCDVSTGVITSNFGEIEIH